MGKRLTCQRCAVSNVYDVPLSEITAPQRDVKCLACGHKFVYGFAPEYVTEAASEFVESNVSDGSFDGAAEAALARERLVRHVVRHAEYADRDRDVLLLHLLGVVDHLADELAAIKRAIDVLTKRK
jgi:hypothetical protein